MATPTISEAWDQFVTSTQFEWRYNEAIDNIGQYSPTLDVMRRNATKLSGGRGIRFAVTKSRTGNEQYLDNIRSTINPVRADNKIPVKYTWNSLVEPVMFDADDEDLPRDKYARLNLMMDRYQDTEQNLIESLSENIFSATSTSTSPYFLGMAAIIDPAPGNGNYTVGGLKDDNYTFWQNQAVSCASFSTYGMDKLRVMSNLVNVGSRPGKGPGKLAQTANGQAIPGLTDIIVSHDTVQEYYEEQALSTGTLYIDQRLADVGIQNLRYKKRPWIADKKCAPQDSIYFINLNALQLHLHNKKWMYAYPLVRPENSMNKSAIIHTRFSLVVNERRKLGVIHSITS